MQCKLQPRVLKIFCARYYAIEETSSKKTYYDILEVNPSASLDDIRVSYLKLSKLVHPDTATNNDKDNHNAFIVLSEAYSILSKPELRRRYDEKLGHHVYKSQKTFQNPFRSSNYKDPYVKYDNARRHSERWTDYYSTYGPKRARYKMEQNVNKEFWQQHWEFTRQHGGGGPRIATHEMKNVPKSFHKTETGRIIIGIVVIVVICLTINYYSTSGQKDREKINADYNKYLLTQFTPEHDLPPAKPLKFDPIGIGQWFSFTRHFS